MWSPAALLPMLQSISPFPAQDTFTCSGRVDGFRRARRRGGHSPFCARISVVTRALLPAMSLRQLAVAPATTRLRAAVPPVPGSWCAAPVPRPLGAPCFRMDPVAEVHHWFCVLANSDGEEPCATWAVWQQNSVVTANTSVSIPCRRCTSTLWRM